MAHHLAPKSLHILPRGAPLDRLLHRAERACLIYLVAISAATLLLQSAAAQSNLPSLKITGSDQNVTVSWPLSGYYFVLETTTNSFPSVLWRNSSTASKILSSLHTPTLHPGRATLTTNIVGDEISVTMPVTNAQQFFRLEGAPLIPVFSFGVFYNGLLEFSTSPTMTINGPVHANGPIYTGSGSTLAFNDTVTTSSDISSPANNGQGPWEFPGNVLFNASPQYITNMPALTLPIGTNDPHALIEMPPPGEDPGSALGQQRLFNQAHVVILVSNTTVTAKIQSQPSTYQVPGEDPLPILITSSWASTSSWATVQARITTNFPFLTITNYFLDQRENKTNLTTQIDVARYAQWIQTNASVFTKFPAGSGVYATILYVANCRTNNANQLSSVRLTNGVVPPYNGGRGWTVATPNPLYVLGNYNCPNPGHLATSNTSAAYPCALMSDALTILSPSWKDVISFTSSDTGPDASVFITVNAAILTGIKPSTGNTSATFSGGVHNLPRLLENWTSSRHVWLNTSIINLYNSTQATGQFITPGSGSYYTAPSRHFSFNRNFLDPNQLPPGTPMVSVNWPAD